MKKILSFMFAAMLMVAGADQAFGDLVISGVFDGPLGGGTPKGVELYVVFRYRRS